MALQITYTARQARQVLFFLWGIALLLVVAYLLLHVFHISPYARLRKMFNLNEEGTIPAWFSSAQLLAIGCFFLLAAQQNRQKHLLSSKFLAIIGLGFVFLSADESAAIQEAMSSVAEELNLRLILFRGNRGAWITVYFLIGLIGLFVTYSQVISFWKHYRREGLMILLGTIVFVAGAVGLEVLNYLYLPLDNSSLLNKVEVVFEESFEMVGMSIILYGVMLFAHNLADKKE